MGVSLVDRFLDEIDPDETVEILRSLVKLDTVNPPGNEIRAASYIAGLLRRAGIPVELMEVEPGRPNLYAILGGPGTPKLTFEGHMDVVPVGAGEKWSVDPFSAELVDGRVYGRGSADAKGSLTAMVETLLALRRAGFNPSEPLALLAVMGEETGNMGIRHALKEGFRSGMAVVGEPTGLEVKTAHKGILGVEVTARGRTAHAAMPWAGVNAIVGMARLVLKLEEFDRAVLKTRRSRLVGSPSLTVTTISGGVKRNVVPDRCSITIDRRLIPGETPQTALSEIQDIVDKLLSEEPQLKVDIGLLYADPPSEVSEDEEVVQLARKAVKIVRGRDPGVSGFGAHCDMGALVNAGIPTVVLGPGDLSLAHRVDENLSVEELVEAAKVYTTLAVLACS
ncbi:M20 family peptidase [Candidatus Bathyarchaeota archaeon]|nr:MAG: M20 family peptidase [Candidatus Bathyarchaeota archaeon]